jgi:CheY-like chemotaxis protein
VDGNRINLKVIQRMLIRLGVEHVKTFNSGSKVLEYLAGIQYSDEFPNLILSDIQMVSLTSRTKAHGGW